VPLLSTGFRRPVIPSEGRGWQSFLVIKIAGGVLTPIITNGHRLLNLIAGDNDRVSIKDYFCPDKFLIRASDAKPGQFCWGGVEKFLPVAVGGGVPSVKPPPIFLNLIRILFPSTVIES